MILRSDKQAQSPSDVADFLGGGCREDRIKYKSNILLKAEPLTLESTEGRWLTVSVPGHQIPMLLFVNQSVMESLYMDHTLPVLLGIFSTLLLVFIHTGLKYTHTHSDMIIDLH